MILGRNLILISALLLLITCSSEKSGDNKKQIEIRFWHSFVASSIPALNKMIVKFENENPDLKINAQYVPSGDPLIHKLVTAIQSGTTPDISWIHSDFLEKLVESNSIYSMNYFIDGPNGFSKDEFA
ncbi:MAG: extracellular solute-binding protein, partial [Ignavibacteriae bacterium]|nr:extracellular solute-binding protein [Ignavibacteriota bacterium]